MSLERLSSSIRLIQFEALKVRAYSICFIINELRIICLLLDVLNSIQFLISINCCE